MTLSNTFPARDILKTQAKRLRSDLATRGQDITHAQALETVAHQWGARDWNTLCAMATDTAVSWAPGQRVHGHYLGHPFAGVVRAARQTANGYWSLTLKFDDAIDVVTSEHFSAWRKQVNTTVNPEGQSPQKTSDGRPHMVLQAA